PNGNITSFTYDNLSRITQKTMSDDVIKLSYDVRGNLTQASNSVSETSFTYDVIGRPRSTKTIGVGNYASLPSIPLSYAYDNDGNRITMTDPTGTTTYAFNAADHLQSISNSVIGT